MCGYLTSIHAIAVTVFCYLSAREISEGFDMLSIGIIVCCDIEAKKKTERNNAGKLEPGYSPQFDAAASIRHEQEKSIRPTRLLSKGLPPWERVGRIKAFGKGKKKTKRESSRRRGVNSSGILLYSLSDQLPLTSR